MRVSTARALEACKALGLELQGLTLDEMNNAYRAAAKDTHPDTGTFDPAKWSALQGARKALSAYLAQPNEPVSPLQTAPQGSCRACGGTGLVKMRGGFGQATITRFCVLCNGTGNIQVKDREE